MKGRFNKNDIIVRVYDSGRVAICLYVGYNFSVNSWENEIYLGESFTNDGGLDRFHLYSMGDIFEIWGYRLATVSEIEYIISDLDEFRKNWGNMDLTYYIGIDEYKDLDTLLLLVRSKSRKEKLRKLKML